MVTLDFGLLDFRCLVIFNLLIFGLCLFGRPYLLSFVGGGTPLRVWGFLSAVGLVLVLCLDFDFGVALLRVAVNFRFCCFRVFCGFSGFWVFGWFSGLVVFGLVVFGFACGLEFC